MTRALNQLQRLRAHQRREATVALRQAEADRDAQRARVDALVAGLSRARDALDGDDAFDLATWSAYRLQAELGGRRERARLASRQRETDLAAGRHRRAVQDELGLANVVAARDQAEAEVTRRSEGRILDEVASRLRRVA
ncbi:MAG: hypothetical protein Q8P18_19890 [Pseudomonadota bacterium]|nr:hypothetical protein [Pseudomonadota bacterium]